MKKLLTSTLTEYIEYYKFVYEKLSAELLSLPHKGSIKKRLIGNLPYYYLQFREGKKVIQKYMGKNRPIDYEKYITRRKEIQYTMKELDRIIPILSSCVKKLTITIVLLICMSSLSLAKVIDFYFNGEIDGKSVAITQIALDTLINETSSPEVRFWVNSPGGSVVSSIALYDYLIRLRKDGVRVDTYATGMCASGATVVLQAGQVRYMTPFTLFMVHGCRTAYPEPKNAWEWLSQKYDAFQDRSMRKFIDDDLRDLYICRTHLPRKVLEKMMERDCWLHAIDAKELGFVDKLYIGL